jgi:2-polyprenyl-3-methyl-5-hydroxy-6-metoxy-1,4-benzoquinol methylase
MTKAINSDLYLGGERVETIDQLVDLYRRRVREFGMSGKTMFYLDEAQHQTKVAQFATLLHRLVGPSDTVLDIGCGYGSLGPLLPTCRYLGIDLVQEFISYAKQKYNLLEFKALALEEYDGTCDWGILLGVVNSVPHPEKLVELAWSKCQKGLLVDFVDRNKLAPEYNDLNRFDTRVCLTSLLELGSGKVEVHPTSNVWTIFVATRSGVWLRSHT